MSDALICPKCGTPYKRNQLSCMKCNFLLFDPKASTVHIRVDPGLLRLRRAKDAQLGEDPANTSERMLHLQIRGLVEKLAFEEETEIVLGRVDLANPDPGRFDLTPFGGHERGVSRAHALLRYADNQFMVTDLNSANGTTVNQKKLLPNEPLVLHDGDQLMLGSLSIGVRLDPKPSLRKTGPLALPNTPEPQNIYETPPRMPLMSVLPKTALLGETAATPETTMPRRPANLPETASDAAPPVTPPAIPDVPPGVKIDSSTKPMGSLNVIPPVASEAKPVTPPSPPAIPEPVAETPTKPAESVTVKPPVPVVSAPPPVQVKPADAPPTVVPASPPPPQTSDAKAGSAAKPAEDNKSAEKTSS